MFYERLEVWPHLGCHDAQILGLVALFRRVGRLPMVLYEEFMLVEGGVGHLRSILLQVAGIVLIVHVARGTHAHRLVQHIGA